MFSACRSVVAGAVRVGPMVRALSTDGGNRVTRVSRRGPVTWASVVALVLGGGAAYTVYQKEKDARLQNIARQVQTVGKPQLGGPFSLVDEQGLPVTENNFKGKFALVYFGFTMCPDICPDELDKLTAAINIVDKEPDCRGKVQPLFISVDPHRDTVKQNRIYIKDFHPRMKALTGTPEQLAEVAREFRVYFSRGDEEESDEDYLIDHSVITYLMDEKWEFSEYFGKNKTAEEIGAMMINAIRASQKQSA